MDWFKPTSETVAFVAETCLAIVIVLYLLSLKQKSRLNYLFIGLIFSFFIYAFVGIFYSASFPSATPFLKLCNGASVGLLEYCWLLFVFYFPKNYHPKEAVAALLLLLIPTVYTWFSPDPSTFTLGTLTAYTALFIYIVLLYKRKIKKSERLYKTAGITNRLQAEKEKKLYKVCILASSLNFILFASLFLVGFNLLSLFAWTILLHVFTLAAFTINTYSVLNYSRQATSFRAKLSGIILCVALIVLGILPFMLLGSTWFDQTGNKTIAEAGRALPQKILYNLMILIPAVTLLIVALFPVLFKNVILQPLNQILSGVQKVNAGKLDTDIKVEVNDEIGALSKNFNQMTSSLKLYADKMNDLVDERTAALNKSLQELKSTQAQLIQSEKMASLGELTAGIAHEIQNPLNFVNNFSEINTELVDELKQELSAGHAQEALSIANDIKANEEKINHHGKRADAIVKGMLQHSRKNAGQTEPTDINALCDEYLRLSYHGLRAKDKTFNANFKTDFDESVGKINIVPQDIGRVLLNLFNNAFYAVHEHLKKLGESYEPAVSVRTKRLADNIEIRVQDNGMGILKSLQDKIFQPFFTAKPTGQGTGLGLSLSYDIIKAHGGELKVESIEDRGAAFIIELPRK